MSAPSTAFSAADFLEKLRERQVEVLLNGGNLRLRAPEGVITEKVADRIRKAKPAIIEYLRQQPEPPAVPIVIESADDLPADLIALGAELDDDLRAAVDQEPREPQKKTSSFGSPAASAGFLAELEETEYLDGLPALAPAEAEDSAAPCLDLAAFDDLPPLDAAPEFEDADAPETAEAVRQVYIAACAGLLPVERVHLQKGHSTSDPCAHVVRSMERITTARRSLPVVGWNAYLDGLLMERVGVAAVAAWWEKRKGEL